MPSPSGVPDAITPRDSISSLKNAMYARVAERVAIHLPRAATSFCQKQKLALNDRIFGL
ncbi:hypothetical protein [uncultured Helicobacter sp.]|uniref:hypothetical protein n=1 Tax=uncultured Helicobacter sp. TaxID=175537 RepID=UPI003753ACBD